MHSGFEEAKRVQGMRCDGHAGKKFIDRVGIDVGCCREGKVELVELQGRGFNFSDPRCGLGHTE